MKDQFSEYSDTKEDSKEPITEQGSPEGGSDSIHIPSEFLQGKAFKEGDSIVLKVVAADDEGVEVEYATEPASDKNEGSEDESVPSANDEIDAMNGGMMA